MKLPTRRITSWNSHKNIEQECIIIGCYVYFYVASDFLVRNPHELTDNTAALSAAYAGRRDQ